MVIKLHGTEKLLFFLLQTDTQQGKIPAFPLEDS